MAFGITSEAIGAFIWTSFNCETTLSDYADRHGSNFKTRKKPSQFCKHPRERQKEGRFLVRIEEGMACRAIPTTLRSRPTLEQDAQNSCIIRYRGIVSEGHSGSLRLVGEKAVQKAVKEFSIIEGEESVFGYFIVFVSPQKNQLLLSRIH